MDMEVKEGKVRRPNGLIRGMSEKCLESHESRGLGNRDKWIRMR